MHLSSSTVVFFQLLCLSFLSTCVAIAIDDPVCISKVATLLNQTGNPDFVPNLLHVDLPICIQACGGSWNWYGFWDVQGRIASWIVPLFILISLAQFAPLRRRNSAAVVLHLLGDPISSTAHLLWKLENTREYYAECQVRLPTDLRRSAAIILSAYEEWENVWYEKHPKHRSSAASGRKKKVVADLAEWLKVDEETRREVCLRAAKELVLWRAPGLWKTSIGILNYVVAVSLAFIKVVNGDYNNRTGHSIAYGMLYSWLIPVVFLTSLVGAYQTKSSTKRVLLQMLIETDTAREQTVAKGVRRIHRGQRKFLAHLHPDTIDYHLLECCGGNPSFSPWRFSYGSHRKTLYVLAVIPFIVSTLSAVFTSYFNPTSGVGCRTIHQTTFFASWLLSALLTWVLGRITSSARSHWSWTLAKDATFLIPQLLFFCAGFVGWFNSCFCWSAAFSLHEKAYVVLQPAIEILNASTYQWPILTGVALGLHFTFIGAFWWYYKGIVHLFRVSDGDEDDGAGDRYRLRLQS
jgi:hypothetical protein